MKKLDDFVCDIFEDKPKQKYLDLDVTFEKIKPKNTCVMGCLSKLWVLVEEACISKEKQVPIDLDSIRAYIEKTVLLLSQTSNYITYFRRYNILGVLNCLPQQSKEMLKKEASFLERYYRNLFGKSLANTLLLQLSKK